MGQCFSSSTANKNDKPSNRNVVSSFTRDAYATAETKSNVGGNRNNNVPMSSSFARDFYDQNHNVTITTNNTTATALLPIGEGTENGNDIMNGNVELLSLEQQHQHHHNIKKSLYKLSPNIMTSYTYRNLHKNVKDRLNICNTSGVVGMKNLGNTCFMNSSLQCLSNTIPLADYFLGYNYKSEINKTNFLGTGGKIVTAYASLMNDIWIGKQPKQSESASRKKKKSKNNRTKVISPHDFKSILEEFAPQFEGYSQQDAQELLAYLLDGIHEDLNRVTTKTYIEDKDCDGDNDDEDSIESWKNYLLRNKSIIVDLFQGQLRNTLQCRTCQHKSIKFEPFMYLSLPIVSDDENGYTANTLNECLELFCRTEILQGDNVWFCPKCKTHVSATKKLDLWMLPPILIIHFKRFNNATNNTTNRRTKLNNKIQYPIKNLDLSIQLQSSNHEKPIFDLYAISHHVGDLTSGHYTAQALNRVDNKWYDFNDSHCSSLSDYSDGNATLQSSSSAYCLFYNRITSTKKNDSQVTDTISASGPMVRRQTLHRPELWPHMQSYDDGQFRSFRRNFNDE